MFKDWCGSFKWQRIAYSLSMVLTVVWIMNLAEKCFFLPEKNVSTSERYSKGAFDSIDCIEQLLWMIIFWYGRTFSLNAHGHRHVEVTRTWQFTKRLRKVYHVRQPWIQHQRGNTLELPCQGVLPLTYYIITSLRYHVNGVTPFNFHLNQIPHLKYHINGVMYPRYTTWTGNTLKILDQHITFLRFHVNRVTPLRVKIPKDQNVAPLQKRL